MRRNEVDPLAEQEAQASLQARPSLGLTRGRMAVLFAGFVLLWLIGVFARQVGEAAAAADQADAMRARNEAVVRDIKALQAELDLIGQPGFVDSAARGYMLGSPGEIPFTIDPDAPPLPLDAPGSVGIRADPAVTTESPLDAWLRALFGSD
jgi:cell division protein FtsB